LTFPIIRRVRADLLLRQQEQQEEEEEEEEEREQPKIVNQEMRAPITKKEQEESAQNFRKSIYENFTEIYSHHFLSDDDDDDSDDDNRIRMIFSQPSSMVAWTMPLDPKLITMHE